MEDLHRGDETNQSGDQEKDFPTDGPFYGIGGTLTSADVRAALGVPTWTRPSGARLRSGKVVRGLPCLDTHCRSGRCLHVRLRPQTAEKGGRSTIGGVEENHWTLVH